MTGRGYGVIYIGYYYCSICEKETAHYTCDSRLIKGQKWNTRKIFCDMCRVLRLQKNGEEKNK